MKFYTRMTQEVTVITKNILVNYKGIEKVNEVLYEKRR